jgi:hypothetical protein
MPFGRKTPKLTAEDFLMGAAEHGRQSGRPELEQIQEMLWDLAGGVGEQSESEKVLQMLLHSPLKDHEAALLWVVEEATRVGILRKEYETVQQAVALGLRLAFKFDSYLRAKGVVFLDVDVADLGRGHGYRHFMPLPETAPLEIEEEFVALGESFRRLRGAYAISNEFIRSLKHEYERGDYRPPLTLVIPTAIPDREALSGKPCCLLVHVPQLPRQTQGRSGCGRVPLLSKDMV